MNPSILITPNSGEAGKLFSIIPTDGAGDLNVVRNTTATYVDADGLIKTALANEVRFDYSNGSCPSILVEPQRTNLLLQSEMFTQSPWTGNAVVSANTNIAPDGTLTADTLTDISTTSIRTTSQNISVPINSTITFSVFIKKTIGAVTNYPSVGVVFTGSSTKIARLIINTTTGEFNISSDSNITLVGNIISVDNYWRILITTTDNGNNNNVNLGLFPAISVDGTIVSVSATGSAVFWGAQLEVGSNVTSYIPTTTTSVTRNADVISKSGISDLIGQSEGTIFAEFNTSNSDSSGIIRAIMSISDGTFNNRIDIYRNNNNIGYINSVNNVTQFNGNVYSISSFNENMKIVISYKLNSVKFFINGVLVNNDTTALIPICNRINIGSLYSSTFSFNGLLNNTLIFKTALSDAECIALTTL